VTKDLVFFINDGVLVLMTNLSSLFNLFYLMLFGVWFLFPLAKGEKKKRDFQWFTA